MILFEKTGKENTEQAVKLGLEKAMLLLADLDQIAKEDNYYAVRQYEKDFRKN